MYKAKRLGRKMGRGFFLYPPGTGVDEPGRPDPNVETIITAWATRRQSFAVEQIADRLLLPMVLEATRILEEKAVDGPCEIDEGTILGLGFPRSRGGLLQWADQRGLQGIVAALRGFSHLGPRVEPTSLLLRLARERGRFHASTTSEGRPSQITA
jgi:3-hydroxyacyl-CoA dehydrogenase/enoyl-CoA hydratase/3-hydroxybutyryl-CoA epimerase/3-hydroxyacyl-CoA dehydrogenase/enoyl-CoA hydratase/3-hydroxybutyryl-CoA epimerase/enoyl-CoA isomerase